MKITAHDRGNTHPGIVPPIIAILAAIVLPRYWGVLPTWARVVSVLAILAMLLVGFIMLGQPSGFTSLDMGRNPDDDSR